MKKLILSILPALLILTVISCKKSTTDDTTSVNGNFTGYYNTSFKLNDTGYTWVDGKNAVFINYSSTSRKIISPDSIITEIDTINHIHDTTRFQRVTFKGTYTSIFADINNGLKLKITTDTCMATDITETWLKLDLVPNTSFVSYFNQVKTYTYKLNNTNDGVTIQFIDKSNKVWSTATTAQSGATFSLKYIQSGPWGTTGQAFVQADVTYNCKVYNGSDSKTLSGTSRVYFLNNL